jgi:lysosomal acid lipase/cholesteryl ester hydrolase
LILRDFQLWELIHQVNKTKTHQPNPFSNLNILGGSSTQTIVHWLQTMRSGRLAQYDYGEEENQRKYGNKEPPLYEVEKLKLVDIPMFMFRGEKDTIIAKEDMEKLSDLLSDSKYKEIEDYSHIDYVWASNADEKIYNYILEFFREQGI